MKPTMKAADRATAPDVDRWRYGERHVRRVDPDGRAFYETVPLKQEDLLFPQEGDRPVLTDDHSRDWRYLFGVLDGETARHSGRRVLGDHRIDFEVRGIEPLGPDLIVLDGVGEWDGTRGTFPVRTMGAKALLTIEITSPDTRVYDLGVKVELYHTCKVQGYAVVDRQAGADRNEVRVVGFRRTRTRFVPLPQDEQGRVWLEPVGLWLGVEGDRAVCYDESGKRIAPPEERARAAEAEARAARRAEKKAEREKAEMQKRIEELEAELRRTRGKK
jgi:hypothetical protein